MPPMKFVRAPLEHLEAVNLAELANFTRPSASLCIKTGNARNNVSYFQDLASVFDCSLVAAVKICNGPGARLTHQSEMK